MTTPWSHREMRLALTQGCNFKCVFCHNEGLDQHQTLKVKAEDLANMAVEMVQNGCTDLTLTGGEPLLRKDAFRAILTALERLEAPPALTLVTNGSLLDDPVVARLASYPARVKIHVSLHAGNPETFAIVTQKPAVEFARVIEGIQRAVAAGLTVKVNHVLLRDINDNGIADMIRMVRELGAQTLKIIELLVIEQNRSLFHHFMTIDVCDDLLRGISREIHARDRCTTYVLSGPGEFQVETVRCTCAMGCARCLEFRDWQVGSDLALHPCFARSARAIPQKCPGDFASRLRQGNAVIQSFIDRYGASSPTLWQKARMVAERGECFFAIRKEEPFVVPSGWHLERQESFQETYWWPTSRSPEWTRFELSAKVRLDHANPGRIALICARHRYDSADGLLHATTQFLSPNGPIHLAREEADAMLAHLGLECAGHVEWNIERYRVSGMHVSFGRTAAGLCTLRLEGTRDEIGRQWSELRAMDIQMLPITTPLPCYVLDAGGVRLD